MRKTKILGALLAVFAFSAMAVASASATLWLIGGKSIPTEEVAAPTHGLLLLHHSGGLIGNFLIHCTGLFDGFVGPGALDLVTKVLGLKGEENKVECEFSEGGGCGTTGAKTVVTAIQLPWHTLLLLLPNGKTDDHFLSETGKEPGYEVTCPKVGNLKGTCKGLDRADFLENGVNGAIFHFLGETKTGCSDGGEGTTLGLGEVLGAFVS